MRVTQTAIARRVGMDVSSVNKILNHSHGAVFKKETVRRVMQVAKELGYDFEKIKYHHRRRHLRKAMSVEARVSIYLNDGRLHDRGTAMIRDLSVSGAFITDIALSRSTIPVGPVEVGLRISTKPLDQLELRGTIVRFEADPAPGYGIQFAKQETGTERRLRRALSPLER